MATSKKYNYKANRDEIIQEALELIAVYDPGETLSSEDISACSRSLRLMIQAFRANDIGLWANKEAALFLQKNIHLIIWARQETIAVLLVSRRSLPMQQLQGQRQ